MQGERGKIIKPIIQKIIQYQWLYMYIMFWLSIFQYLVYPSIYVFWVVLLCFLGCFIDEWPPTRGSFRGYKLTSTNYKECLSTHTTLYKKKLSRRRRFLVHFSNYTQCFYTVFIFYICTSLTTNILNSLKGKEQCTMWYNSY